MVVFYEVPSTSPVAPPLDVAALVGRVEVRVQVVGRFEGRQRAQPAIPPSFHFDFINIRHVVVF